MSRNEANCHDPSFGVWASKRDGKEVDDVIDCDLASQCVLDKLILCTMWIHKYMQSSSLTVTTQQSST
eukprot:5505098-Amphidinium_carterae.1